MSRLPLKLSDVKKLFALSGNTCAFPECNESMIDKSDTIIGEICHIEAAENNGQRYNKSSNDEYRRSFENLILLCPKHHKITNDVFLYPTKKLKEFKSTHEKKFSRNEFKILDEQIDQAIGIYMNQQNKNESSGIQVNNQAKTQKIGTQIGVQNIHNYDKSKKGFKIDGARKVIEKFKNIIDAHKQKASPPSTEVIDFRNELIERFERPVELIPTKILKFRKDNGRIIAEVESYEKEKKTYLNEADDTTQEILRKFLLDNDKEKNEELKKLLAQKGQQRPAIITCDGFLINGNRRKMALEELYRIHNEDSRFEMMRVVILPEGATELEIQKIENRYQLQGEGKSEYQGLNRAIKIKRNIENKFSLEAQLRDDPNYHDLPLKDFEKIVKRFEKDYLKPLQYVDKYLETFNRQGLYNTISEGVNDSEGRWQAFIDYSNFCSSSLDNKSRLAELKIKDSEIGKIENAVFKIIRKRSLNSKELESTIGKVHEFVRKLPKYLGNPESKKFILKIVDEVDEDIPKEQKLNKEGKKFDEREIDEIWGNHFKQQILGNLMQAHKIISNQIERDKPLELLEDALKKLKHENLNVAKMSADYYEKALKLTEEIVDEADKIHKAIDNARFKLQKLKQKGKR